MFKVKRLQLKLTHSITAEGLTQKNIKSNLNFSNQLKQIVIKL